MLFVPEYFCGYSLMREKCYKRVNVPPCFMQQTVYNIFMTSHFSAYAHDPLPTSLSLPCSLAPSLSLAVMQSSNFLFLILRSVLEELLALVWSNSVHWSSQSQEVTTHTHSLKLSIHCHHPVCVYVSVSLCVCVSTCPQVLP